MSARTGSAAVATAPGDRASVVPTVLEGSGLRKAFGTTQALDDASLGGVVAVMGASG